VVWTTSSVNSQGNFNAFDKLQPAVGRWCGSAFLQTYASETYLSSSLYTLPQGLTITTGGATIAKFLVGASNSFTALPGNNDFVTTTGTMDNTAPTCTAANFAQTSISTGTTGVNVAVSVTCTGAQFSAAIVRAASGGIHKDSLVTSGSNYAVPLLHTGSADIIGVVAIDSSGNAVVYGSCGDYASGLATLCGGGSASSTVVASLAVVMMCIVIVLQLAF